MRVGTRDICLRVPTNIIMEEISNIADAIIQATLEKNISNLFKDIRSLNNKGFCIMALGKLGGRELNYSSDIDLIAIKSTRDYASSNKYNYSLEKKYTTLMENTCLDLSSHTEEGYVFRVDLRLRPFGNAGPIVQESSSLIDYYHRKADLWEIQALLKMRPVAGDLDMGMEIKDKLNKLLLMEKDHQFIKESIKRLRKKASEERLLIYSKNVDIKTGIGGIRDVEFLVQGLQMMHAWKYPDLIEGNTIKALEKLADKSIISNETKNDLTVNYVFLRRLEHFLQIMDDRQVHYLPHEQNKLDSLAKRMLGPDSNGKMLLERFNDISKRLKELFTAYIG